jgi:phage major head subunit gpT-like protein
MAGLTGTPEFLVVEENGEYTYASFGDIGESFKLWTAGRIVSLSRQLIINDQLGLFGDMAGTLGRGAALHEANAVWATLLGNPTLSDGVPLFHANHGNLAAVGSAPTVQALGAARAAMRKQKDRDGTTILNIVPKFLVIGPDLETATDQLLTQIQATQVGNAVPAFIRSLTVVVDPRITDYSWYLLADPNRAAVLQHAYLRGQRGIYTDTRVGFEVDGVEYKGRLDFSAKARGFQGAYRNPGAAPA